MSRSLVPGTTWNQATCGASLAMISHSRMADSHSVGFLNSLNSWLEDEALNNTFKLKLISTGEVLLD